MSQKVTIINHVPDPVEFKFQFPVCGSSNPVIAFLLLNILLLLDIVDSSEHMHDRKCMEFIVPKPELKRAEANKRHTSQVYVV